MYLPKHFEETRPEALLGLIAQQPLATLVVSDEQGLAADHIPLFLRQTTASPHELIGHVARANPLWQKAANGIDCLAIFHGGQHYISPNWYATKAETGKVVPTWNYEVVHVQGKLFAMDDAQWLRACLADITAHQEADQPKPWKLDDAPEEFIDQRLRAIVGIRIEVARMFGKAKLSQNQPAENRQSVIEALSTSSDARACAMAEAIQQRNEKNG